ncbi:MAG: SUMF1/EgtB/PvdO family nonheme iron enzyme [Anaerolineae bacterium]|nr:SUMF1/EgtB/PvdO family nonheme iron enzyme [Anaerolineae bacterium]
MMKKIFPLFFLFLAACQPAPTTLPEATAIPSSTSAPATQTATATVEISSTATPTAAPTNIRISAKDGMTQLYIPAGTFTMGGMDVYRENDEQPAHEVTLNAFWMDQVEVTNGMYGLCVQAGICRPPVEVRSDNREEYFGNPEFNDYPVVFVTWYDADVYCTWSGRRLPTEAEWEYAARGNDKRNYPWGDELPNEYTANFMNLVGDTTRVGSYAEGASPFGVLDLSGNVWEWVADRYRPDYYSKSTAENPQGPTEDEVFNTFRVIRGGSFQEDGLFLRLANRSFLDGPNLKAQSDEEAYYGKSSFVIGFRCAQAAE